MNDAVMERLGTTADALDIGAVLARREDLRLEFSAKQPETYGPGDLPATRRMADYIAAGSPDALGDGAALAPEGRAASAAAEARSSMITAAINQEARRGVVVGHSAAWHDVLRKATQVAATQATVFLQGESGTGKEVVARYIHRASPRKNGPFVAINCAALPETLLESELFGYERGAFTGAQQSKPGQLELASGGVLFLDEVSEMSPAAQAKFLRVLQEREFQRLGGTRPMKANIRVIAASNRDLAKAVARGSFREDLYYRLQVFDIQIPPLRARSSDIPLLAESFLDEIGRSMGRPAARLCEEATQALMDHHWPGNVRELRNVLERAAILSDSTLITPDHLSLRATTIASSHDLRVTERSMIERVLRATDWNKAKAARKLGLSRTQLYVRLRKYDLLKLEPPRV